MEDKHYIVRDIIGNDGVVCYCPHETIGAKQGVAAYIHEDRGQKKYKCLSCGREFTFGLKRRIPPTIPPDIPEGPDEIIGGNPIPTPGLPN